MNIEICINTNNYSGKDVQIDLKDIMDFTKDMYILGNCETVVKFECMPAAVPPDLIQVVFRNMEHGIQIIGSILTFKEIVKVILDFLKKCRGYEKVIAIDNDDWDVIEITDKTTDTELQGKILAILAEQQRKIGRDISKIISDDKNN